MPASFFTLAGNQMKYFLSTWVVSIFLVGGFQGDLAALQYFTMTGMGIAPVLSSIASKKK